ncbi:IS3 family transposase [Apilactobacillus micheneri]|uniref:IS3 family transposase n=1 Tax=Apilactobacillus micheneri TaxID=1899430 RepID=A0A9Q8MTY7_9LACO|nr:IS3 family transposase [Apilactobacillus micheneri]TPR39367.1 IS3 family transposase [Apilactobacillus micheneri]TPR41569.1 IS3 family transposase [Apilactobacillus micheneri]TPR43472.1 IS3 family transposase [Apilactobacillus micheneri]TPR44381.1 IS3 family transposase [Apilactobacillus micheneri]TPR44589.1 IS3 family transposase [Apilactobacillus micheneri]
MVKFSYEFKLNVVLEYLQGYGSTYLCKKYNIVNNSTVLLWINMYKAYGLKGLIVRNYDKVYSGEYKIKVLNWIHTHHKSYPETALQFNISASSTIFTWQRRMETKGIRSFYNKRGRPKMKKTKSIINAHQKALSKKYMVKYHYEKIKIENNNSSQFVCVNKLIHQLKNFSKSYILKIIEYPRSLYYYNLKKATLSFNKCGIEKQIKKIILKHTSYGYHRVTAVLRKSGLNINHKRVQKIMKRNNWQCKLFSRRKRKYNSYKGQVGKIAYNILNGDFTANKFGQKITTDVSEFRYGNEDINHRVYLSPVMNLYSDKIISFNISKHPNVSFTLKALNEAMLNLKSLPYRTIVHSDQGFQYQHHSWANTLKKYNAIQYMSRKGTCLDNAQMESFFHIMKSEMI